MLGLEFEVYDDVPDHINVYMFAKFFDKFNLRVGKTALLVEFPFRLAEMDCDKDLWSDSTIFRDTLAVYFISSHFKLRQSRKEALALLPRVEAALSVRGPDQLREAIFLSNSLCFNDGDCARSLYELMLKRLVNTALARSALEGKHLISPLPNHPTTSVDCVSRSAVFRDWYETRNLASPLDFDTGELEKTRLGKCTCQGACYRARAGIMRGLKLELARIENEYMSVNLP